MPADTSATVSAPSLGGVDLAAIRAAAAAIAPHVVRTPTLALGRLAEMLGRPVVGKFELLQHTGSFKVRGAFARMLQLSAAERSAGVVAVSAPRALGRRCSCSAPRPS